MSTAPTIPQSYTITHDEPGRTIIDTRLGNPNLVDCAEFHFVFATGRLGGLSLFVRHGAGDERFELDHGDEFVRAISSLDSDSRFRLALSIMNLAHDVERRASTSTARRYEEAFVEGRMRKRKLRGKDHYKVTILPQRRSD